MSKKENQLRLMPEFGCWPVWSNSSPYNVNPADLPISVNLRDAIYDWGKQYNDILNLDDPVSSCFSSQNAESAFKAEGVLLLNRLRAELGDQFELTLCV